MSRLVLKRLLEAVPLLTLISLLCFALLEHLPGGPLAMYGANPHLTAVERARLALPGMTLQFVPFPGSTYSTDNHYAVFFHGDTPLTEHLTTPALIDARTGELTAVAKMPWYVKTLSLSQPVDTPAPEPPPPPVPAPPPSRQRSRRSCRASPSRTT